MNARDVMTPNPMTIRSQATVAEAWDLMGEMEIRHVPVVDDGTLVGMLSDRDLGRLDVTRMLVAEGADALRQELATPVAKLMSLDVIAAEPETELGNIVDVLVEQKVGALPVVHPDTRELVGIISYIDVLRALQDLLGEE